ncbi:MAG: hypothetical protein R8P61_30820 [Bacteroidia bacterium]|nr:hypothetical protein [Bacteroidia bacterium]
MRIVILLALLLSGHLFAQSPQSKNLAPGSTGVRMEVEGLIREFIVHTPPTYDANRAQAYPVVFMFHGGGGTGMKFHNTSGWKEKGDQEGIITVFPTAYRTCLDKADGRSEKNYWMTAGKLDQLCANQKAHDDVPFVEAILDHLNSNYHVESRKIYASGFSNGMGFILSQLLPRMSDRFAAFGGVGSLLQEEVNAANASPTFAMIGSMDDHFTGHAGLSELPHNESGVEANTFLKSSQETILNSMGLGTQYKVRERPKYLLYRFEGTDTELRYAILKGLAHVYPKGRQKDNGIVAAKVFWDFFQQYSL